MAEVKLPYPGSDYNVPAQETAPLVAPSGSMQNKAISEGQGKGWRLGTGTGGVSTPCKSSPTFFYNGAWYSHATLASSILRRRTMYE